MPLSHCTITDAEYNSSEAVKTTIDRCMRILDMPDRSDIDRLVNAKIIEENVKWSIFQMFVESAWGTRALPGMEEVFPQKKYGTNWADAGAFFDANLAKKVEDNESGLVKFVWDIYDLMAVSCTKKNGFAKKLDVETKTGKVSVEFTCDGESVDGMVKQASGGSISHPKKSGHTVIVSTRFEGYVYLDKNSNEHTEDPKTRSNRLAEILAELKFQGGKGVRCYNPNLVNASELFGSIHQAVHTIQSGFLGASRRDLAKTCFMKKATWICPFIGATWTLTIRAAREYATRANRDNEWTTTSAVVITAGDNIGERSNFPGELTRTQVNEARMLAWIVGSTRSDSVTSMAFVDNIDLTKSSTKETVLGVLQKGANTRSSSCNNEECWKLIKLGGTYDKGKCGGATWSLP